MNSFHEQHHLQRSPLQPRQPHQHHQPGQHRPAGHLAPLCLAQFKVRDLFDSMYRGYPVGYFLLWQTGTDGVKTKVIGDTNKQKVPSCERLMHTAGVRFADGFLE